MKENGQPETLREKIIIYPLLALIGAMFILSSINTVIEWIDPAQEPTQIQLMPYRDMIGHLEKPPLEQRDDFKDPKWIMELKD